MQQTSETYQRLIEDPRHRMECKVVIAGKEYGEDCLVSMETFGGLFAEESMCAGSAAAREAELSLRMPRTIPAGAEVCPWYRVVLGDETSEWIQKGSFVVDTRSEDKGTGVLTFHCFDALALADRPWEPDPKLEFPMPMPAAAKELARLIGTTLDPRTKLNESYYVDYPTSDPDDPDGANYFIRQILRWIAAAHGGNWTITETGLLRLVPLRCLPAETSYLVTERGRAIVLGGLRLLVGPPADEDVGQEDAGTDKVFVGERAVEVTVPMALRPVSKIVLMVDDEHYYEAGDDSGQTMELSCPYGTQAMADKLLEDLGGYVYQPIQVQDALIDPAAELGDGVTAAGIYAMVAEMATTFDGLMASDISAPGQRETESEIGTYAGPSTQLFNRQLARTRSQILKTANEIRMEIVDEIDDASASFDLKLDGLSTSFDDKLTQQSADFDVKLDGISSSFTDQLNGLSADFDVKLDGLSSRLTSAEGSMTELSQSLEGITTRVESAEGDITEIRQTAEGLSSSVEDAEGRLSTLEQTATSITSRVDGLDSSYSELSQTVSGFEATVKDLETGLGQTVRLGADGVTITNAAGSKLTINGGQIDAESLNLRNRITFNDLDKDTQDRVNDAGISEEEATTLITSTLVSSPRIEGADIYGGTFHDADGLGNLELTFELNDSKKIPGITFKTAEGDPIFQLMYLAGANVNAYGEIISVAGMPFLSTIRATVGSVTSLVTTARGNWAFTGSVSGVNSIELEDETTAEAGAQGDTGAEEPSAGEPKETPKVKLMDKNGKFCVETDGVTWYLDANGLHQ